MWVRFYQTKLHCKGWLNPLRPADAVRVSLMDKTIQKFTDDVRAISGGHQTAYRSELKGSIATISPKRRSWTWAAMIRESEVKLVSSLHICDDLTRGDWGSLERLRGHSFITQSIRTSRTSYLRSRTSRLKDRFFPDSPPDSIRYTVKPSCVISPNNYIFDTFLSLLSFFISIFCPSGLVDVRGNYE